MTNLDPYVLVRAGSLYITTVLTAAVWRMNAAMWANPWVLLAAAVAGAAYAIYANWGPITAWVGAEFAKSDRRGKGTNSLEEPCRIVGSVGSFCRSIRLWQDQASASRPND